MLYGLTLEAIQRSRTGESLDAISRALWSQTNSLSDEQAQALAEAIQARRQELRPAGQGSRIRLPRPKTQRARNRKASSMRRRQLAASGPMPPIMAAHFTTAELAALKIVADEVRAGGVCALVLDAIAARAGVSKRTVQNAMREAEALGFIEIRRCRPRGQLKNLPNQVRIIAEAWRSWLKVARLSTPRIDPDKTRDSRYDRRGKDGSHPRAERSDPHHRDRQWPCRGRWLAGHG